MYVCHLGFELYPKQVSVKRGPQLTFLSLGFVLLAWKAVLPCYVTIAACYVSQVICEIDRTIFSASMNPLCKLALVSHSPDHLRHTLYRLAQRPPCGLLGLIFLILSWAFQVGGRSWFHSIGTMHLMVEEPVYFEVTPPRHTTSLLPWSWAILWSQYLDTILSMQMSKVRELFWRKVWVLVNAGAFLEGLDTLQSIYLRWCSSLTSQWTVAYLAIWRRCRECSEEHCLMGAPSTNKRRRVQTYPIFEWLQTQKIWQRRSPRNKSTITNNRFPI